MVVLLVVCQGVLAAVFAVAGLSKAADHAQARADARALGISSSIAGVAARMLACGELAVAIALLADVAVAAAAIAALAVVSGGAARALWVLLRGRDEDCGCFGSWRRTRVGIGTLGRDALLIGVALLLVGHGDPRGPGFLGWVAGLPALGLLSLLGALCLSVALATGVLLARRAAARRLAQRLVLIADTRPLV